MACFLCDPRPCCCDEAAPEPEVFFFLCDICGQNICIDCGACHNSKCEANDSICRAELALENH